MSKISDLPISLVSYSERVCTFCGGLTNEGGHWCGGYVDSVEDFKHILVCDNCKDKLLHLYIDVCMDCNDTLQNIQIRLNDINKEVYGKEYNFSSIEEAVCDYAYIFDFSKIAKKKARLRKEARYREYLKLKKEFGE